MKEKIVKGVRQYGLLLAALLALFASVVSVLEGQLAQAALSLSIAIAVLAMRVILHTIQLQLRRTRKTRLLAGVDGVGELNANTPPNVALLREMQLNTLEEVRVLKAEIAQIISDQKWK